MAGDDGWRSAMALQVTCHHSDDADRLVGTLLTAGYGAGVRRELFAGDDAAEAVVHVVHTDAPADEVEELVEHVDAWVEVVEPLTTAEAAPPVNLPDSPRRRKSPPDP
jgi:hypothetical protein